MEKNKNIVPDFFVKQVAESSDLEYLTQMLKYVEMDRESIQTNRKVMPKLMGISEEEYVKGRTLLIDQMETLLKSRIAELKPE
jgi:hypothetical protein